MLVIISSILLSIFVVLRDKKTVYADNSLKWLTERSGNHNWVLEDPEMDCDSDLLDDNLQGEVHMFCGLCGFDITEARRDGRLSKDLGRDHSSVNGCTHTGTVSYVKTVTIHTPAIYRCADCGQYCGAWLGTSGST
ncbi:MAG: hypothetical protein IKS48_01415 [Eubacterium sp.]|nr:hypothetical protein [Eubacterium sp.]